MIYRKGLMGAAAVLMVVSFAILSVETWTAKGTEETAAHRGIRPVRIHATQKPRNEAERDLPKRIAEYLGISRDEVEALIDKGVEFHDLVPAAAIAKLGDRDVQVVLKEKTEQKTWHSVAKDLGVDPREFRREMHRILPAGAKKKIWLDHHPEVVLKSIAEYLEMDEKKLKTIIKREKVRSRDWLKAAVLSKISGKPLDEVMAMRKNRSWLEVASALGVSREEVFSEMERLKKILKKHAEQWDEEHREAGEERSEVIGIY